MINEIITNQYLYYIAIIIIGIYMTVDIPSNIKELYKNKLFKISILSIILTKLTSNLLHIVLISSAVIFGVELVLNKRFAKLFSKERFQLDVTDGGFKLSGVRQHSKTGESKILRITQSSSDQLPSVSSSESL